MTAHHLTELSKQFCTCFRRRTVHYIEEHGQKNWLDRANSGGNEDRRHV